MDYFQREYHWMWIAKFTYTPLPSQILKGELNVSGNGKVAKLQGIQWLDSSIDFKITSNLNFGSLNVKPYKEGSLRATSTIFKRKAGGYM